MWQIVLRLECEECGLLREEVSPYAFVNWAAFMFAEHRKRCWKRVSITQVTRSEIASEASEGSGYFPWHLQPEAVIKKPHYDNLAEDYD